MRTARMKATPLVDDRRKAAEETIFKARRLIDSRVGIINSLWEYPARSGDVGLYYYGTKIAETSRYFKSLRLTGNRSGGGAALVKDLAIAKAIGESVERYCASMYDEEELIYASFEEMGREAIPPDHFTLFSEQQYLREGFPFSRFTTKTKLRWISGHSLIHHRQIYVPALFVYVPYRGVTREELIYSPTSNGLAAASTVEEAILKGICEVVERDAYVIMWLNRLSAPGLEICGCHNDAVKELAEGFKACGIKLFINDITTNLQIPTLAVLAVTESGEDPAAFVAAAAHLDPMVALLKSLEEAGQTRFGLKDFMAQTAPDRWMKEATKVDELFAHPLFYADISRLSKLAFISRHPKRVKFEELENKSQGDITSDLSICLKMIASRGLDVIVVDITTPDIADTGLCVVRTIIPGTQPLDVQFGCPYLGGKRLYEVPRILGYRNEDTREEDINPDPHPFP